MAGGGKRRERMNGKEIERENARTPRAAVTAGTTSAMRQPTATFNVARPVIAPGTICEHRWIRRAGVACDIKDARARSSGRVTRFRDWAHGNIDGSR